MFSERLTPLAAERGPREQSLVDSDGVSMRRDALLLIVVACLGCDNTATPPSNPALSIRFTSVSAGTDHACALDDQGRAWCWGSNFYGQLGVPIAGCGNSGQTFACPALPTPINSTLRFSAIATGTGFSCGLLADGHAYCWGGDIFDQLGAAGTPSTTCGFFPCSIDPLPVSGGFTFTQIASGGSTTCGITTSSVGKCWGDILALGRLLPPGIQSATPLSVTFASGDSIWDAIARPGSSVEGCGITDTHQAACWGDNSSGQLGNGTVFAGAVSPLLVTTPPVLHGLAVGEDFACGLDASGAAYCWGSNRDGTIGNGTTLGTTACAFPVTVECVPAPTAVVGGRQFASLSAGWRHVCGVITGTGDAYCWGFNESGAVGSGSRGASPFTVTAPALVTGGIQFSAISAGDDFTCGLSTTGGIWCWGDNILGQLGGMGPPFFAFAPVRVVPVIPNS
jgi:alpha-tubulin suppressor-like RCC1 family protein